ncbi:MAG: Ig-like domain-containing protein [Clostridia bacterium]|nr:Ig-like domain-containing protein [Clostridia bacterium]
MKPFKKFLPSLTALVLLLSCTIAGLVLPVAAEGDTFKLMYDELYLAPKDSGGYVVYGAAPALKLDGQPYTEALTWTSSKTSVATVNATNGRIVTAAEGITIITATNAAGESHSCTVTVAWDGERISGGDFEGVAHQTNRWTNSIIKSGKGEVITEETGNNCLMIPAGLSDLFYANLAGAANTTYVVSFDIKGDTGEIKPLYLSGTTSNGWKYATPKADGWKRYSYKFTTGSSFDRSYILGFGNMNISSGTNTNPIYIDNVSMYQVGTAESVAMNAETLTLMEGETSQMTLTASPADSTLNRAQWSTNNEAVATVDKNGLITAVAPGTATITAKCGLLSTTCEVTVTKVAATGIAFDKTELELNVGDKETLAVSILPEGAELEGEPTWKSSDETVATVENGTVTAVSGGTATIVATVGDFSAACAVTVSNVSASDTFKLAKHELYIGPSITDYTMYAAVPALTVDGKAYAESLTWTSSNTNVVKISNSSTGLFYSVVGADGTAIITATNAAGESHSCKVTVAFDGDIVSGGDFESVAHNTTKWTKELINSTTRLVVEDTDGNHMLKIPAGTTTAKYYYYLPANPGKKYVIAFDVKGNTGEVKAFTTSSSYGTVFGSSKSSYNTSGWQWVTPNANEWKHYEFYFETKASINRNYILGFGNSSTTEPIYFDNISFYELGTAESIELGTTKVDLEVGDTVTLPFTASPEGATFNRIEWSSSNEAVATVDKNGKITALSAGTTTITAKSGLLEDVTCTVTVHNEFLAVTPDVEIENGTVSSDAVFGTVQPDDIVTVTVTPEDGYIMVPGSLKYTKKDGTVVRVLNETWETRPEFGRESAGNTFQFVMPEEKVTLTAEFIPTTEQNFAANTIGTSFHYVVDENDEPVYDGIRFLTRLNLANKFDAKTNTLTVTYGGVEYTVLELGSLLKREQSTVELTYENAVANAATSGVNKMWVSKSYTADSGVFKLVDYTDSYIDFASVMMTKHYDRFYTARGYIRLQAADESIITLEFDEITNSISAVVPILPPVQTVDGVTAEKSCWTPIAHTVAPGEKITYQIDVTTGETAGTVTVFEPIPLNTTYLSGADELIGKYAVWTVELAANETKTLTYTVQIANDIALCDGGSVVATDTQIGNETITGDSTLYIERTVNSFDAKYFNTAMKALADSSYTGLKFVYWAYYVAYTNSLSAFSTSTPATVLNSIITGDATYLDAVAPTLYGGTAVSGAIDGIKGEPAASVKESDLMIGDVLLVKNNGTVSVYVYCDTGLMKVKSTGGTEKADSALLNTLTTSQSYAVIRPRSKFLNTGLTDPYADPDVLNERQEAVIKTAEAFLMRGEKVQYDDTKLADEYRWRLHEDAPEDATYEYIKYTNCAAFCNDSYYFGLGYSLPDNMYTTFNMVRASANNGSQKFLFTRAVTDVHTEEEMKEIHDTFMNLLQPGDLMIVLRDTDNNGTDDSGHVMMYIGNGKMIHSTGSSYSYYTGEVAEPSIRYGQVEDYFFNSKSTSGYVFGTKVSKFCLVRPLDITNKTVPENTTNRINNLTGIVAQKYASVRPGITLNNGDTVTYTFDLRNTNTEAKTLTITDTIPVGTEYVSGTATVNGDALSWNVTIPADTQITVSYTLRIADDTASGTKLLTEATVGGVAIGCPAIVVGNTLTIEEQTAVIDAVNAIKSEGTTLTNIELANEIYTRANLGFTLADTDLATITLGDRGIFTAASASTSSNPLYNLVEGTVYRNMVAPTLYGGQRLYTSLWTHDRTRFVYEGDLVVGDIIVRRLSSTDYVAYMYVGGNKLFSLTTAADDTKALDDRLELLIARYYENGHDTTSHYFAVLRPSLTMGSQPAESTEVTE